MPSKTYLRYSLKNTFGVISSSTGNILTSHDGSLAIVPALQDVIVWNLKTEQRVHKLSSEDGGPVTSLAQSPDQIHILAGHDNGTIRLWNMLTGALVVELKGHRKAVTSLAYNSDGSVFASGSKDTDIILWDSTSESGLFRLRGHTDMVTDVAFLSDDQSLISSSKDTLLKVWDISTQHCVQTCVGHRGEVWSVSISPDGTRVVTGSTDNKLRVWKILPQNSKDVGSTAPLTTKLKRSNNNNDENSDTEHSDTDENDFRLEYMGHFNRSVGGRVSRVAYSRNGEMFGCMAASKSLELFRIRSPVESKKKMKRRYKRKLEKARKTEKLAFAENSNATIEDKERAKLAVLKMTNIDEKNYTLQPSDEFETTTVVRTSHKLTGFTFAIPSHNKFKQSSASGSSKKVKKSNLHLSGQNIPVLVSLSNNTLQMYLVKQNAGSSSATDKTIKKPYSKSSSLELQGHRGGIRSISLSHDDTLALTTSKETAKIWRTGNATGDELGLECIRTLDAGYGLCSSFVRGDKHVVVGTKDGMLRLFSLASGDIIFDVDAHEGSIWALAMKPNGSGFATGSADKTVKFWDFELDENDNLQFAHVRTLKMNDEVMCLRFSHAKEAERLLIAIALLDCTVKIFYDDTLKFSLSLYGHKLPVMAIDISSDDTTIITGSADKNVKIWGLDFGDCHKSIFAHADSIMSLRFIRGTHQFFTTGKDGLVKYWDGDTYDLIQELKGHVEAAWCSVLSHDGDFLLTGGEDMSLRLWTRSQDQVFLEEEEELRMEEIFEAEIDDHTRNPEELAGTAGTAEKNESTLASLQSKESLKASERIIEALDLADAEKKRENETPKAKPNVQLLGLGPTAYVMRSLRMVKSQDLEQALLVMPFFTIQRLFNYLVEFARLGMQPELTTKCVTFLLTIHHNAITSNRTMEKVLRELNLYLSASLREHQDCIGHNIASLKLLQRRMKDQKATVPTRPFKKRKL
eukprot:g4557.t1